jgi:hypothetical protein
MWQPPMVERALFRWHKWRKSIINYWVECRFDLNLSLSLPDLLIARRLRELDLHVSHILELYWICCVSSDYNFDYPATYKKIATPLNLQMRGHEIKPGIRIYPPTIMDEKDLIFESDQRGLQIDKLKELYSISNDTILLQSGHELFSVLSKMRGRPRKHSKRGPIPRYSDHLAVRCAALKDYSKISYVGIAEMFKLPISRPFESKQSDVAVNLVNRGRKLLKEL